MERAYTVANFRNGATAGCGYSVSPSSANVAAVGGVANTTVTATAGCAWNATPSVAWLSIGAGSGTSGNGSLSVVAAANPGPARNGVVNLGSVTFTVSQASGCTYTLSPSVASVGSAGGAGSFGLTTGAGCTWQASSGASWASVSPSSGSGSATLNYTVSANGGAERSGALVVGGEQFLLNQAGVDPSLPNLVLSFGSLNFGKIKVGSVSAVKTSTLTNNGGGAATLGSLALGGANPSDFEVAAGMSCAAGQTLNPGQSCVLAYAFKPTTSGTRAATVTVNGGSTSAALSLTGSGVKTTGGKPGGK
jgi:hypothetical protein